MKTTVLATMLLALFLAPSLTAQFTGGTPLYPRPFTESFISKGGAMTVVDAHGQAFAKAFRFSGEGGPVKVDTTLLEGPTTPEVGLGLLKLRFSVRSTAAAKGEGPGVVRLRLSTSVSGTVLLSREVPATGEWTAVEYTVSVKWPKPGDTIRCQFRSTGGSTAFEIGGLQLLFFSEEEQAAQAKNRPRIQGLPPAPAGKKWSLAWGDEFEGTALDESKWNIVEGKRQDVVRNRKAVALDGKGNLVVSIYKEGNAIYNGWVDTKGKFEHRFGYYTARIRLQSSPGHWSAFWLQTATTTNVDGSGRDGSEIDVMEKPGLSDIVNHAIHWDGYGKDHRSEGIHSVNPGITEGWHTFSVWWTADAYVFYVDDYEVWRTTAGGVCQVPAELRLTDEASAKEGNWAGSVLKANLPDAWHVDYVRVYDLVDEK